MLLTDQSGIITCLLVIIITCLLVIVIIITCLLVIIIITVIVIMQALTRYQIKQVTAPPQPSRDDNADNKASLTIVDSSGDELDGDVAARTDASSCKQSSADAGPGPGPSEADDYKEDFEEYEEETSLQEEGLWSPDSKQAFIDVDRDTNGDVRDDSRSPSHPSLDVQRSVSQSLTEALV